MIGNKLIRQAKSAVLVMIILLSAGTFASAGSYYVTQSGAGARNGSSLSNAWSVSDYNSSSTPTGGDTVYFSGMITSTVAPNTSGGGNGVGRLTLDFSSATLNTADPRIRVSNKAYLNINGGTFGMGNGNLIYFDDAMQSHDITIQGWTHTGASGGLAWFAHINYSYNVLIQNNTLDNIATMVFGHTTNVHDITISNNYARTSTNTAEQSDLIKFGDAYNITINGNKLIQRAPGAVTERHNDVIQTYHSGSPPSGDPYNWVIKHNWIELDVASGSGDTSWLMLEDMKNNPACKIYGNVFVGRSGTVSNNGICIGSNNLGAGFYFYNNTVVLKGSMPENTITFLSPGTLYAKNNIGYAANPQGTGLSWTMTEGGMWDRNYFYSFTGCSLNCSGPNGSCSANPQFTDITNDDFSLQASSPCMGAGEDLGSEYSQGIARGATWPNPTLVVLGKNWAIGAYQGRVPQAPKNLRIVIN